jgi:hypothetical protein
MSIYQWLCLLGVQGIITLVLSWVISKKLNTADAKAEQAKRETAAIAEGVKALLRDRLLQGYKHYIEKGWADMDDRTNMENVWRQYHALGGNGDMNDLRRTFRHLPMAKDGAPTIINQEGDESV